MENARTKRQQILLGVQCCLITILVILSLLKEFIDIPFVHGLTNVFLFVTVAFLLPLIKGSIKYMALALFFVGATLFLVSGSSVDVWLASISINHMLVALFVATPLLGIPFQSSDFLEALKGLYVKYIQSPTLFSSLTQAFAHLMAVVLNLGAISIFLYLSSSNPNVRSHRLISAALIRSFSGAVTWSPFFAAMALIVSQLPVEWKTILPYLLGFVLLAFVVSVVIEWSYARKHLSRNETADEVASDSDAEVHESESINVNWKKLLELMLLLVGIMGIVFLFEGITELSMVAIVIFTAYICPFVILIVKKQFSLMKSAGKRYLTVTLPDKKKEVVLFLLIGFFSGAVAQTPFGPWLSRMLTSVFGDFTFGISLFIALSMIIISSFGFHPVMVATLYVTTVDPAALDMSVTYFAVLLLGAWGIATAVSPMTAVNFMVASFMKEPLVNTSIRWNTVFSTFALVTLLIYLSLLAGMNLI